MTANRKPRRMARELYPQSATVTQTEHFADDGSVRDSPTSPQVKAVRSTKQSLLTNMLRQESGASLTAIVEATGWLPHTTRAALTGLRKKGHAIERFRSDDETRYRIAAAPAETSVDGTSRVDAGDVAESSTDPDVMANADAGIGITA